MTTSKGQRFGRVAVLSGGQEISRPGSQEASTAPSKDEPRSRLGSKEEKESSKATSKAASKDVPVTWLKR